MKNLLFIFAFLYSSCLFSQAITVDNTTNSPAQLVDLLLGNSCVEVSNISVSSTQSVAYFNQNGSSFPISEGVIIRNGVAINTQGPYTGLNLGTTATGGGVDAFLQNLSNTNSGSTGALVDLAYLEFEFTTYSNSFNFDFVFASNEYGEFQCLSRDIVAFELTDISTGVITNIGLVPTTSNPISTATIKDDAYNASCSSTNPTYFGLYNVPSPAISTLNMRGHSVSMNASANIIPLNPYRLKLVIADYISTNYDSAIFISPMTFTRDFSLGNDTTICAGDTFLLDATIDNTYSYQWFLNSAPIAGETNPTYTVTQPGIYSVEVTKGSCIITDEIIFNALTVNNPNDLSTCDSGGATNIYNLTLNNEIVLGIDNATYDLFYFETPADIASNNFIPLSNLTNYAGTNGQTIYIKIFNINTGNYCDAVYIFNLTEVANVIAGPTSAGNACEDAGTYDLSVHDIEVINGQTGTHTISYYNSQADAISGINSIGNNAPIPVGPTSITYWIRIEDASNSNCFDVTSVVITINPLPVVDDITDPIECSQYTLPVIVNGTYYLLSGGPTTPGQIQYNTGDILTVGGTYYIFAGPDANGCTNESSFNLTLIDEYVPQLDHCGRFIVPTPPENIGNFYTQPGGPSGTGDIVPSGFEYENSLNITSTVTLYYYAEVNSVLCRDEQFIFFIHPLPLADDPADVVSCDNYILPALVNGNYFSGPNGTGVPLFAGDVISVNGPNFPGIYYVYNELAHTTSSGAPGSCSLENPFQIDLVDTSVFTAVSGCSFYTLPAVSFGGYFTAPNGGGSPITDLNITSSQIVYYYTNTTTLPNCTGNLNYNITIYPQVPVDTIGDDNYCGEYILPALTNGTYYSLSGGPTVPGQTSLSAGDIINLIGGISPGTYYIYNEIIHNNGDGTTTTCSNEDPFTITISPFPDLYQYASSRPECDPYFLATPAVGAYYTEPNGPNGTGVLVDPNTEFATTETFYFYYEDSVSGCRVDKRFQILFNGVNLPTINDIVSCDSAMLNANLLSHLPPEGAQSLYHIEFHLNDPSGPIIDPNTYVFNSTNTPTPQTVCLYAVNDDGFLINCPDEEYFTVSILETPVLPSYTALNNQNYCGLYTLPAFPVIPVVTTGTYTVNYYSQPGGNAANIISPSNYTFTNITSSPETHNVWVYAQTTIDGTVICSDEETFQFTVYPLLDLTIAGGIICVDANDPSITILPILLDSGLNPADFIVEWYLNGVLMGTGQTYLATVAGTYNVITTKILVENPPDCNYKPTTVLVEQSSSAVADFTVSTPFENNTFITVNLTGGFGDYLYQLVYPNGSVTEYQSSNVFTNLPTGEYYVNIYDILGGCTPTIIGPIYIINYPNYFTPNGDGVNDNWNIWDLSHQPDAVINIFDRYGKFLKQMSPASSGWDGTYNGEALPSSDYWFTVEYLPQNGTATQIFKAHFSLKR